MRVPFLDNELLLGAMELFTGEGVDLDTAERAFAGTRGDFRAKLTAALQAVTVARLKPERFVEIPDNPESLSKAELWALVEPNIGFIRSSASKAELVDALTSIRYRQERRPAWMPRTPDSVARPAEDGDATRDDSWSAFTRVLLTLTGLPELGQVAAEVPSWYEEPVYAPDALTATTVQLALLTALGIGPDPRTEQTVTVQDPIPDPFGFALDGVEVDAAAPLSAADGYAAVTELLATTATLGGIPVSDEDSESAALEVLASAKDWWYSPAIVLDCHSPFGDETRRTVARCSAAGWANADSGSTGFVIVADAIAADSEGTVGSGGSDLHRFMLWWELPGDGKREDDDSAVEAQLDLSAGALHRLVLHCPGEDRCLRDECPSADAVDIDLIVAVILGKATAVASMLAGGDWATGAYLRTLVDSDDPGVYEEPGAIMWMVEQALASCGWRGASHGFWDTGDMDRLLYRDGHVILIRHHLAERALSVLDGIEELELLRDMDEETEALATHKSEAGGTSDGSDGPYGSAAGTSQHSGDGANESGHNAEDDVFRECLQRLDSGTMTPVTGLGLRRTPLLTLWPWGDGQPHGEMAQEKTSAWIKGWLRGLPGIA